MGYINSELRNKVVVITGASGGVGRATAREFGKHGAKVVLIARGADGLNGAKLEVEAAGGEGYILALDVADAEKLEEAAGQIEQEIGPIAVWVNNAMNSVFAPFTKISPRDFKRVTEVTYLGQVYGTMAALKYMKARNHGSIVLVGSALAYRGIPLQSAYCGAKHAVEGFFDSLRCELLHDKSDIKLSIVQLPALNTTQFGWVKTTLPNKPKPMGKVYQPEVAARAVVYAALEGRREYYVGFPTFQSVIGNKIAPGLLDRYLASTGVEGQQTNIPLPPGRKDNLWEPVPGDQGTYGEFGADAKNNSFSWWISTHRALVTGAVIAATALVSALIANDHPHKKNGINEALTHQRH